MVWGFGNAAERIVLEICGLYWERGEKRVSTSKFIVSESSDKRRKSEVMSTKVEEVSKLK